MATVAGAAGAIQTATIAAQQPPKMANGGVLGGTMTTGDNQLFFGNSGERVLTANQNIAFERGIQALEQNTPVSEERVAQIAAEVVKSIPVNVLESDVTETQRKVSAQESAFTV